MYKKHFNFKPYKIYIKKSNNVQCHIYILKRIMVTYNYILDLLLLNINEI